MVIITHLITLCYIISTMSGVICLCFLFFTKNKFHKLFGVEYDVLNKFLLLLFLFFLANFFIYYNEFFMSYDYFKTIILILFDSLLIATNYYGIKLNALNNMNLILRLFTVIGGLYICVWSLTYLLDFSGHPVIKPLMALISDAMLFTVLSGILMFCCIHQLRYNEDIWEKRFLVSINVMLMIYVFLLYCTDLFVELSHAYVSRDTAYPYYLDPVILIFIVINGFTVIYLAFGMQKVKAKEKEIDVIFLQNGRGIKVDCFYEKNHISVREREVLDLIVMGDNNAEIAEKLSISVYTVKRHINSIFKKLEVKSRFELLSKIQKEKSI